MQHITCSMDRTSGGTTSPWHYTITWGIYCLQRELYRDPGGQAVQQARLRGTHSPCPSFINFFAPISINMSLNICSLTTQFWTLKESGALCSLEQGQNSSSPLWKNLVKLILYYSTQCYKSWGTVSLTRYLQNEYKHSSRRPPKKITNLQKHFRTVLQWTTYSDILSLLSL